MTGVWELQVDVVELRSCESMWHVVVAFDEVGVIGIAMWQL